MIDLRSAWAAFKPSPDIRSRDWFNANLFTHEDTGGRPYDEGLFPHSTAPGGPSDALDDPKVQTIWLQWGSRLGKSFFAQCAMLFMGDVKPCPMMHANADEDLAKSLIARTYGMMQNSRCMRKHLKPAHKRRADRIDFQRCKSYVAWARSSATLADKAIRFGHGGEIDKWEHQSTSGEADPLGLFTDRGKEFRFRKFILESTPAKKDTSRVERGRLASTNCQYYVPCPHCGRYQRLAIGQVRWEKLASGRNDKALAKRTGYYECEHCQKKIEDHHRAPMMQRGVWVPEGCTVDDAAAKAIFEPGGTRPPAGWSLATWIKGTPARDAADAGYQLSSLYALYFTWGDIAEAYVNCLGKPQLYRNFINQWLAETWEDQKRKATWEQIGERIIIRDLPRGIVPAWGSVITFAADRQAEKFPWSIEAWGPDERNATIAYGAAKTLGELSIEILKSWPHAAGGAPLKPAIVLVDRGYNPKGVHDFCAQLRRKGVKAFAVRGSNHVLDGDFVARPCGKNTSNPGDVYIELDTISSQLWLEQALYDVEPGGEGSIGLYTGSVDEHEDYLQQLINDAPVTKLDVHQNARESWDRKDTNHPNDYRDTKRYGYCGRLILFPNRPIPPRGSVPVARARESASTADDEGSSRIRRLHRR